jgi:hypothetical protein
MEGPEEGREAASINFKFLRKAAKGPVRPLSAKFVVGCLLPTLSTPPVADSCGGVACGVHGGYESEEGSARWGGVVKTDLVPINTKFAKLHFCIKILTKSSIERRRKSRQAEA